MPEMSNDLRETLARLHEQLRSTPDISAETRTVLQRIVQDIHSLLGETASAGGLQPGPSGARHDSIVRQLANAEQEFQAVHPTLAGVVGSVIDALGRMGI
ncbi:MAG TPA: DUF4404 family protein [Pirellulales bacterium]|jgi:hypothetical protein